MVEKRGDVCRDAKKRLRDDTTEHDFDITKVWPDYQINKIEPIENHVKEIIKL